MAGDDFNVWLDSASGKLGLPKLAPTPDAAPNFLAQVAQNPNGWGMLPPPSAQPAIVRDEYGQPYDAKGNKIVMPDPSLGESLLNIAESPAKLAVGAVTEPFHAIGRLAKNSVFPDGRIGIPNPEDPQNRQDVMAGVLSLYGGNAMNPGRFVEGAAGRALPDTALTPAGYAGRHFGLHPDDPDFGLQSQAPFADQNGVNRVAYDIANHSGDDVGRVELSINPTTGEGYLDHIALGNNDHGTGGMRDVIRSIRAMHPEITSLYGDRTSGIKAGSENPRQVLNFGNQLFSDNQPSLMGSAVAGAEHPIGSMPPELMEHVPPRSDLFPAQGVARMSELYAGMYPNFLDGSWKRGDGARIGGPNDVQPSPLSAYDASALEQLWRNKIKQTGELYSDTGKPSLMGSALAGAEAQPTRMYHGTASPAEFSTLRPSERGAFGPGVYLSTDPATADIYAANGANGRVFPADVTGPFATDAQYWETWANQGRDSDATIKALLDQGYSGVRMDNPDWVNNKNVTNVFKPGTVRSATTGETLFSDTGKPSPVGATLAGADSQPVKAFHATNANFDKFDPAFTDEIGFHFGNKNQAQTRQMVKGGITSFINPFSGWKTIPVDIDTRKPAVISRDPAGFNGYNVSKELVRDGIAPQSLNDAARQAGYGAGGSRAKENAVVRNWLVENGYDAVQYPNSYEGGGTSYMALGTGNVKHAKTGQVLYSKSGAPIITAPQASNDTDKHKAFRDDLLAMMEKYGVAATQPSQPENYLATH